MASGPGTGGSRPGGGRPGGGGRRNPAVTRRRIVETALAYVERGEEDLLTMRALGQRLGVSSMALYRYFAGKEEILEQVVDTLLARVSPPAADPAAWEDWIEESARALRGLLVGSPAALRTFTGHPVATPAALARMEAALAVLRRAGFDGPDAARAFATVHTYTIGFAALEVSRAQAVPPGGGQASRYWHIFFGTLPPDDFPNLVELAPDLAQFTGEVQFTAGLRSLLAGLRASLPPAPSLPSAPVAP